MLLWCISCLKSEFCNQLFGSVASVSIRCNTTFFCFCVLFVLLQWLLFSQNSFIIAPDLFRVLCMSVFGLQCGCKCFWVAAVNRRQQWRQIWIASAVVWALSWWCPWCFQGLLIRYWWKPGSSELVCVDMSRAVKYALLLLLLSIWGFISLFSLRWRFFLLGFYTARFLLIENDNFLLSLPFLVRSGKLNAAESWRNFKSRFLTKWKSCQSQFFLADLLICFNCR